MTGHTFLNHSHHSKFRKRHFSGVEFKIGRFIKDNTDLIIQDVVKGNILQMADEIIKILRSKYLLAPIHYDGMVRKEPLEIPESTLREAIYNAIVHKDYNGAAIQMKVWNDRIELWNDGTLPEGFTIDTLLGNHTSKPRNKNIAKVFFLAGFIETWGRGIDKMREGLCKANLPEPCFEEHCGGLLVTIKRSKSIKDIFNGVNAIDTNDDTNDDTVDTNELTQRQLLIIKHLSVNPDLSARALAEILSVSVPTIKREMKTLSSSKHIVYVGSPRYGHWEVLATLK